MKVNTLEMEAAVMEYLDIRQNLIVPNASWGCAHGLHECDLISLSKSGYATEVEIKISLSDLKKDKDKKHGHDHNHIKMLFFAVPERLKEHALKEIPERSGLFVVYKRWIEPNLLYKGHWLYHVSQERGATANKNAVKWDDKERLNLARLGTMRILGLKKKLLPTP